MPDGLLELESRLAALACSRGPERAELAAAARELVARRAWERLGHARLSDWAGERVGLSSREVLDLARTGEALACFDELRSALVDGTLGWTKVRLLARVLSRGEGENPAGWIAYARTATAEALSREVRRVDRGALEAGADDDARYGLLEVPCTREVRAQWDHALRMARLVSGGPVPRAECVELIAAEVLSAIPPEDVPEGSTDEEPVPEDDGVRAPSEVATRRPPPAGDADPAALDARIGELVARERRLDARMGRLLDLALRRGAHRAAGFATREAYARERLGIDPSWARALLRIERACRTSPEFERAYRSGRLTALQALALAPLLRDEAGERWGAAWVARAQAVTLRRLRDDVERALLVHDTDPDLWARTGGLPPADVEDDREIGASAITRQETCSVWLFGRPETVRLFGALLSTVRRRIERVTGRLATAGEALGAILDHVLESWCAREPRTRAAHRIFARDGWRCVVPGCTSMRNLHEHHVVFRSQGGGGEESNRTTLCAFHHHRGVHAGLIRIEGKAPDDLRFDLPLASYRSGDRIVQRRSRPPRKSRSAALVRSGASC